MSDNDAEINNTVVDGWFYETDGEKHGPVDKNKIKELTESGCLTYGSKVWKKGFPEWLNIENTDFQENIVSPPPLTGDSINNTIIWFLAFAPIIGLFFEYFFWSLFGGNVDFYGGELFFITVILNIWFSNIDAKKLSSAGHNTSKMGMSWIVPVYLFKRSKILKHNYAYFVVWLLCFIIGINS
jgi:hypothetical protein